MDTFTLAAVLLFFTVGASAQVLEPLNETVLQNTDARFNCSVKTPGWTAMSWTVNGRLALIISELTGPLGTNASYSATNYSTVGEYKWEFVMKAVTAASAGSVGCQVQNNLLVSATLNVQQKAVPRPARDQTVLIAITVAFSLAALLALLIILIVFCCKRRRKKRTRYQDEVRARSLSHRQQATYARRGRVRENFGYIEDTPSVDNRDGVYTISGFRQDNYNNNMQLPEVNLSRYADDRSYDGYSFDGLQKHRHLTIV
ncbi:uncharacterized protein igsf5a isoform X2 [Hemibagrus wyckioides]|uniref:uncharacterized protein igsf5a isoform X2 n=1 Tax=Hemibagrus wyckioides TaxID=337641 RepID=UPI00266D4429|nr:uncharacterized protein igsf5a isoform X2 [Hemibagrus wyckioides]